MTLQMVPQVRYSIELKMPRGVGAAVIGVLNVPLTKGGASVLRLGDGKVLVGRMLVEVMVMVEGGPMLVLLVWKRQHVKL